MADIPEPQPKPGEVKVKIRSCGLNRADVAAASGRAHGRVGGKGTVVGSEWAGEIAALGKGVTGLLAGDLMMGSGPAGFAEYAVTDAGRVTRIPANNMIFAQSATLPVALQTMHDAAVTNGRLVAGEAIVMQGASSGVGLIGMQIAKLKGAKLVIGTSTDQGRRARLAEFGAALALDSRDPKWVVQVLEETAAAGVDLIVDQISGYVASHNLAATRILGRIAHVIRLGGMKGEFDFDLHAFRRIEYIGVTFRTSTVEEVSDIVRRSQADLGAAIEAGRMSLPIDREFPIDESPEALEHMSANRHFGNIVLAVCGRRAPPPQSGIQL